VYKGLLRFLPRTEMMLAASHTDTDSIRPQVVREHLRRLDNRQWWLWSSTVLVLVLLTIAVASFAFPAILSKEDSNYSFYLGQAVRALIGVVLLFSVYLVYQQTLLIRMRNQIADQITSLAKVETLTAEVYKLAALDQLTGLYNRRSGEQRLAEEIGRASRYDRPLTLVMLDLDGLKQINDELGHPAGDAVLKSFAERVQRAIRGSDLAVRLGGDEFIVIQPRVARREDALCFARKIISVLSAPFELSAGREHISACVGIALYPEDGNDSDSLVRLADEALLRAKAGGKGNALFYDGEPSEVRQKR